MPAILACALVLGTLKPAEDYDLPQLSTSHHFTLPYCSWSNGAVKRLGKEFLRVSRALLLELVLSLNEWLIIVPLFQISLKNSPFPQCKNMAPITVFTGRPALPPILTSLRSFDSQPVTITALQRKKAVNIEDLIAAMNSLHPIVHAFTSFQRDRACRFKNKESLGNFSEGNYVFVAHDKIFEGKNFCLCWQEPHCIIKPMNEYVFKVEDLRNSNFEDIHGTRSKLYPDGLLDEKVILSQVLSSEPGMPVARMLKSIEKWHNERFRPWERPYTKPWHTGATTACIRGCSRVSTKVIEPKVYTVEPLRKSH